MQEAAHDEAATMEVDEEVRPRRGELPASTLHLLLGWRPDSHSRFRHNRANRLPHDVVIIDETSMVSLWLIARLIEAVRPDARLVLVGDPGQLTSIEAGAVLADIVGPAIDQPLLRGSARAALEQATGGVVAASEPPVRATVSDAIVVLDTVHRFGKGIARVAEAIRRGDADAVVDALSDGPDGVTWLDVDGGDPAARAALQPVRDAALSAAADVMAAARAGAALDAIAALGTFRLLCAHRRGPH